MGGLEAVYICTSDSMHSSTMKVASRDVVSVHALYVSYARTPRHHFWLRNELCMTRACMLIQGGGVFVAISNAGRLSQEKDPTHQR